MEARQRETLDLGRTTPKQRVFLRERHRHVAYGGARGGGKSHAVRLKAVLLAFHWPGIKLLIVRRSFTSTNTITSPSSATMSISPPRMV